MRPILVLSLLAAGLSAPCLADSPCDCGQYEGMRTALRLAEQTARINESYLGRESGPFVSEGSNAYNRLRLDVDRMVPAYCRQLWGLTGFQTSGYLRAVWDTSKPIGQLDETTGTHLINRYHYLRMEMKEHHIGLDGAMEKSLLTQTSDYEVLRAFHDIFGGGDWGSALQKAGKYKNLSIEARLRLVQMFTAEQQNGYDMKRADEVGNAGDGTVSHDSVMAAMQHNFLTSVGGRKRQYAGVCRDHAPEAAQLMAALGFRVPVVVSYTHVSGPGHATAAAMDPMTRKVYLVNYGSAMIVDGKEGSEAIFQTMGDVSSSYLLHRANDGKTIAMEPTAFGRFLSQVAGFDAANSGNPLTRAHTSLVAPSVSYGGSFGRASMRAFTGGNRDFQMSGVAATVNYASHSYFPGTVGAAVGTNTRSGAYTLDTPVTHKLDVAYVQIEQAARTPSLVIRESDRGQIRANIEALATAYVTATRARDGKGVAAEYNGKIAMEPQVLARVGLRLEQVARSVQSTYFLGATAFPGYKTISENASYGLPVLNDIIMSASGRAKLCPDNGLMTEGCAYVFASAMVLKDYFGWRARAEAGASYGPGRVFAGYQGRLNEDNPAYREGTMRIIYAGGGINATTKKGYSLDIGATGVRSVDLTDNPVTEYHGMIRGTF